MGKRKLTNSGFLSDTSRFVRFLVLLVVGTVAVRVFAVQAYQIPAASMEDTLLVGDFLIGNKLAYGAKIPMTETRLPGYHSPENGEVFVRTENRSIVVEDQGPGLSNEGALLFEKFAPRQPGTQGVGLGLSITKKLVELHGGTIQGENRPDGGARFTVRFP